MADISRRKFQKTTLEKITYMYLVLETTSCIESKILCFHLEQYLCRNYVGFFNRPPLKPTIGYIPVFEQRMLLCLNHWYPSIQYE
jgi:hypothetical protein